MDRIVLNLPTFKELLKVGSMELRYGGYKTGDESMNKRLTAPKNGVALNRLLAIDFEVVLALLMYWISKLTI